MLNCDDCRSFQKGAKIDKPMTDGRTSVIKAMENKDMPMIDILLAADKEQNFVNKSSFLYEMADLYQRDDRGLFSIYYTACHVVCVEIQEPFETS